MSDNHCKLKNILKPVSIKKSCVCYKCTYFYERYDAQVNIKSLDGKKTKEMMVRNYCALHQSGLPTVFTTQMESIPNIRYCGNFKKDK